MKSEFHHPKKITAAKQNVLVLLIQNIILIIYEIIYHMKDDISQG